MTRTLTKAAKAVEAGLEVPADLMLEALTVTVTVTVTRIGNACRFDARG